MILTVCLNPTFQMVTLLKDGLRFDQVNRAYRTYHSLAGKGFNVARVLSQLGADAIHLTHLGGTRRDEFLQRAAMLSWSPPVTDAAFSFLIEDPRFAWIGDHIALGEGAIEIAWADSRSEIRTCHTLLDISAGTTTEIVEEPAPVSPETEQAIWARYREVIPRCSTVVFSGTSTPGYSDSLIPEMVAAARWAGCRVVLDIRGGQLIEALDHSPDVIKPNMMEFCSTFLPGLGFVEQDASEKTYAVVREEMRRLARAYQVSIILTNGREPVLFTDPSGERIESSPLPSGIPRAEVMNSVGAGDAFSAGLAFGMEQELPLDQCVLLGQFCGILNTMQLYPGTILTSDRGRHSLLQ